MDKQGVIKQISIFLLITLIVFGSLVIANQLIEKEPEPIDTSKDWELKEGYNEISLGYKSKTAVGDKEVPDEFLPVIESSFDRKYDNEFYFKVYPRDLDYSTKTDSLTTTKTELETKERKDIYYITDDGKLEYEIDFYSKPKSNEIVLDIVGSSGISFHHQPALTKEEILNGDYRPENIINSYAIYGDKKDGVYTTGKLGHIERSWVVLPDGKKVWIEQEIEYKDGVGTWKMIIPQKIYDDVNSYPLKVAPVLGYDVYGSSTGSTGSTISWATYAGAMPENGTATAFKMYTSSGSDTDMAIYSHTEFSPVSRLAMATVTPIGGGIHSGNFSLSLISGDKYWIAVGGGVTIRYDSSSDWTNYAQRSSYLPATWSTDANLQYKISAWVEYDEIIDSTPTYSNQQFSLTFANTDTTFSLDVNDAIALETKGQYIFSTNNTGTWTNTSATNFTSTPQSINYTFTLNDTVGLYICGKAYLTNDDGNMTITNETCITITTQADSVYFKWWNNETKNFLFAQINRTIGGINKFEVLGDIYANNFIGSGDMNITGNITIGDKITFAFGEFIDNLVDGWLRINGNLNVTGDLDVAGNITGNQIYGGMWYTNYTATELNFAVDGTFYYLFFTNATHLNGFGAEGLGVGLKSNLTTQVAGIYQVNYMATGDGQNNHIYHTSVFVNEVNQLNCDNQKKMAAGGDILTQTGICLIRLEVNDKVSLRTANVGNTGTGNYYGANIDLVRIGN